MTTPTPLTKPFSEMTRKELRNVDCNIDKKTLKFAIDGVQWRQLIHAMALAEPPFQFEACQVGVSWSGIPVYQIGTQTFRTGNETTGTLGHALAL